MVALILVGLTTVRLVAATPPKVNAVAPVRFVPTILTFVAPVSGPNNGAMLVNVGITVDVELKVNADGVFTVPLGVVILT